jgi:hypothetical protein
MPGNYPEENTQHSEHGESLKSRIMNMICLLLALTIKGNLNPPRNYERDL